MTSEISFSNLAEILSRPEDLIGFIPPIALATRRFVIAENLKSFEIGVTYSENVRLLKYEHLLT